MSNVVRLNRRSRKIHPQSSQWGWWAHHATYDHIYVPPTLDVRCSSCGCKAVAKTSAPNGSEAHFEVRCQSCPRIDVNVSYRCLPPLYYRVGVRGRELWAWNREHLTDLLSILENPSSRQNRGSSARSYVRREWLMHRAQFAKAIRQAIANPHNTSVNRTR